MKDDKSMTFITELLFRGNTVENSNDGQPPERNQDGDPPKKTSPDEVKLTRSTKPIVIPGKTVLSSQ